MSNPPPAVTTGIGQVHPQRRLRRVDRLCVRSRPADCVAATAGRARSLRVGAARVRPEGLQLHAYRPAAPPAAAAAAADGLARGAGADVHSLAGRRDQVRFRPAARPTDFSVLYEELTGRGGSARHARARTHTCRSVAARRARAPQRPGLRGPRRAACSRDRPLQRRTARGRAWSPRIRLPAAIAAATAPSATRS